MTSARLRGLARWGWLVTTIALGGGLIGSSWANHRSATRAAEDLVRGEALTLKESVIRSHRPGDERRRADLDSLVLAQERRGLRYLAWVERPSEVLVAGGNSNPTPIVVPYDTVSSMLIERLGSRMRVFFPPPPRMGERARSDSSMLEQFGTRRPPTLVMEFEPVVAIEMVARAERTLWAAGFGALLLVTAGFGFWRLSQAFERNERRTAEERRLAVLGEMSAVLAHEIRNPLASLKGHAQLLLERLPEASAERRKAEWVVDEATRLEVLTRDLLEFARVGPMNVREVDPAQLLEWAAAQVSDPPVAVERDHAPARWPLDEQRLGQAVLVNLLRNAVQASPPGRPPIASVGVKDGQLVYSVHDFGSGLPPGLEEKIFDPFFTTRTNGTGLGLAIARRIVELHGGTLTASNPADGGALFRVLLPRREG